MMSIFFITIYIYTVCHFQTKVVLVKVNIFSNITYNLVQPILGTVKLE